MQSFRFACPSCRQLLTAADSVPAAVLKCPRCGTTFRLATSTTQQPAAPAAQTAPLSLQAKSPTVATAADSPAGPPQGTRPSPPAAKAPPASPRPGRRPGLPSFSSPSRQPRGARRRRRRLLLPEARSRRGTWAWTRRHTPRCEGRRRRVRHWSGASSLREQHCCCASVCP